MEFFDKINSFLETTDEKYFFRFSIGFVATIILCCIGIIFQYYRASSSLRKQIDSINEFRETARIIREKAQHVQDQRSAVNAMLSEDPEFKIGNYFTKLLDQLMLSDKKGSSEQIIQIDREDNYRETELSSHLINMSMKQLTELLQAIEQTKRIYIKKLEIEKEKKGKNSIEVILTIATLLPKTESMGAL